MGNSGFTARAALIGAGLSLFLLMSSTYISIKIGALPWPIIFSVIMSGGILKLLNRDAAVDVHEVNTAQAGASIGGLVAAGTAFTLPGIIFLNKTQSLGIPWPNPWLLGLLVSTAAVLGIVLSIPLKRAFIDEEQLPYPAGTAGAELIKLGQAGGRQFLFIVIMGAAAAIFALIRDIYFPAGFTVTALVSLGIFITLFPMPLGIGAGYILGVRAGLSWFAGAAIGWLLLVPLLVGNGMDFPSARALAQNLGMGMVLGSGIGFFLNYVIPRVRRLVTSLGGSPSRFWHFLTLSAVFGAIALILSGVPWLAVLVSLLGVWIMVVVAARMTGETNIDPLEQFGIFVGLIVAILYKLLALELSLYASFMIVAFVSVSCAVTGDIGHDYKSAALIGTRFSDIVKMDVIAAAVAGFSAPLVLEVIRSGFGDQLFTAAMPAPQAQLVAGSIFGFAYPNAFLLGLGLALAIELGQKFFPDAVKGKVLLMPLGIGLFLGFGFAIPLLIGALIRWHVDRSHPGFYQTGLLIAAGVMGGEGIAGFGVGALTIFNLSGSVISAMLLALFAIVLLVALLNIRKAR